MNRLLVGFWILLVLPFGEFSRGQDNPSGSRSRSAALEQWPQWRGPLSTGAAPKATPPLTWSEDENVRWKIALPGKGHSTPVVWGDRVFVTAAVPYGDEIENPKPDLAPGAHDNLLVRSHYKFMVFAVDRKTGKILWEKEVSRGLPHEGGHVSGSLASFSPCTDGEVVIAHFGSRGLYGLDVAGEILWSKAFENMQSKHGHGEGSSPVLHGNTVVVNWDHEAQSFVIALDRKTGKQIWKKARDEVTSWATPIVVDVGGKRQVVISGTKRTRGYDLETGAVTWECGGLSKNVVASPVYADGVVYVGSSYDTQAMMAIKVEGAKGDVTGTDRVLWTRLRRTPYVPSPLLYKGSLYFMRHYQNIMYRVEAKSGKEKHGPFRLFGIRNIYASPVGAANRIYVTDREGSTIVLSHDEKPQMLALNRLEDRINASAALVGDEIFLRGERYLYCLGEKKNSSK